MNLRHVLVLVLTASIHSVFADGPADNLADKVRRIPPPGMAIPAVVAYNHYLSDIKQLATRMDNFAMEVAAHVEKLYG